MKNSLKMIILSMIIVHAYGNKPYVRDSLRTESRNGLTFVLHKVDPGQTLYSLSKRYNCPISDVIEANPALSGGFAIKVGQEISFPVTKKGSPAKINIPSPKPVDSKWPAENSGKIEESTEIEKPPVVPAFHVVKDGETVYSISRLYNLPQEDLIRMNAIVDLRISPDEKLLVDKNYVSAQKHGSIKEIAAVERVKKINTVIIPKEHKGRKITEVGMAQVINTGNKSSKHLALHRTAPVGSYLNIVNEATGDSVQVKVVGNIDETSVDPDILVKISPSAFSKLKPRDSKIRATISYNLPR